MRSEQSLVFKMTIEERDSPPVGLPLDASGSPLPLELACIQHFHERRSVGDTGPLPERGTVGQEVTPDPNTIRTLGRSAPPRTTYRESFRVRFDDPARYFSCRAEAPNGIAVEFRLVARPRVDHVFMASYALYSGPKRKGGFDCYFVGLIAIALDQDLPEQVKRLVKTGLDDLMYRRCGPGRPRFGNFEPWIATHEESIGDGAVEVSIDESRNLTIRINTTAVSDLTLQDREAAQQWIARVQRQLARRRGAPAEFSRDELRAAYRNLVPICSALLHAAPQGAWPPFRTRAAALAQVGTIVQGDAPAPYRRAIADAMIAYKRRPSATALARSVLSLWTSLSLDWVRRATRD